MQKSSIAAVSTTPAAEPSNNCPAPDIIFVPHGTQSHSEVESRGKGTYLLRGICSPMALCGPISYVPSKSATLPAEDVVGCDGRSLDGQINTQRPSALNFLWLEVTPKCNLQCIHCYADSSPQLPLVQRMQYEDWQSILGDAFALGCRRAQFIGGEPTLYPYLSELIADARNIGYEFLEVFTNGTLLSNYLLKAFREFRVNLAISIYASRADVHDVITRRRGSFLRTMVGICRAIDYGLSVRIGIVAMQLNSNNLERTVALFRGLGVSSVGIDRVRGIGRGNALSPSKSPFGEFCGACWQDKLCVDSAGQVFPCVFARSCQVGYVDEGLQKILEGETLRDFRRTMHDNEGQQHQLRCGKSQTRLGNNYWGPARPSGSFLSAKSTYHVNEIF